MFLTDAQLKSELQRCEYCAEKPCKTACPADCSPADFIMAARGGKPSDFKRAAGIILASNPLGGICGAVCPDYHCQAACSREKFDCAIQIPAVQATIVQKAKELGQMPDFILPQPNGRKVAIIGAGPSGIGTAVTLIQLGYEVEVFEEQDIAGGQANLIPDARLDKDILSSDLEFTGKTFGVRIEYGRKFSDLDELKGRYDAIIQSVGLDQPIRLNIPGAEAAFFGFDLLRNPDHYDLNGKRVALVGGAIAADMALTAVQKGAAHVEMITLESWLEMPLTPVERESLTQAGVQFTNRSRITEVIAENGVMTGIQIRPVTLPKGEKFHPAKIVDELGSGELFRPFDALFIAIGNRPSIREEGDGIWQAGDMSNGPSTVVEAVAAGKNVALRVDCALNAKAQPSFPKATKSIGPIFGWVKEPVPLKTDFFGREISAPFLLSAAPPTDGYDQMLKAYKAGWSGGIMKTAFDNVSIHIPGEYMVVFNDNTYGNCDNVSDHPLDRVCAEIKQLVTEFPDRLTMASTGGPVSGNDEEDKQGWQANTRKLEASGVMGIEYSLSCPQGGDGTHGDIVSQDAALTAKIVDWVMEISHPDIPKLFKLTGAVTAIYPIVKAIRDVLDRYPGKKAGITLANTFPTLAFRDKYPSDRPDTALWDEAMIVGMSGEGVLPISYLTIARAAKLGVSISGNGGPMDYLGAANFLALGAETVQFCSIAEKYGVEIIDELRSGLSHYMQLKGIKSVKELIGIAQPDPITDFMDLAPSHTISTLDKDLCVNCGNCTRCPYLAITLDDDRYPVIDRDKCVGCSLCVKKCFTGALSMGPRPQAN